MSSVCTFAAFWGLVLFTAASAARREQMRHKSRRDWVLDLIGLLVQGMLIPLVLTVPLMALYRALWPQLAGALELPAVVSLALAFVGVDYVYYWNHRLLHSRRLWPLHAVHHSAEHMDVFVTSRNTLWTSLLIVYLWATSLFTYVLSDPAPYLLGAGLTAVLDLARHSPVELSRIPALERFVGQVLVLPRDHALHHADGPEHGNYGANLVWWDKLHGTYLGPMPTPRRLGVVNSLGLVRSLFWPFPTSR